MATITVDTRDFGKLHAELEKFRKTAQLVHHEGGNLLAVRQATNGAAPGQEREPPHVFTFCIHGGSQDPAEPARVQQKGSPA